MPLVIYVEQNSEWISEYEEDLQVHMLKSIWSKKTKNKNPKRRFVFDKIALDVFEKYFLMQNKYVDNESVKVLKYQTNVSDKRIRQWFSNRRLNAVKIQAGQYLQIEL